MTDKDDPIMANPEALTEIAIRAFARAAREAIEENDRLGVPSYGGKDGKIVVRQPPKAAAMKRYRLDPENPRQLTAEEARQLDAIRIDYSDIPPLAEIDWSNCPDAERTPGKVSGAWCVKGARIPVQAIIDNADAGCSAEEIAGDDIPEHPG